VQSIFVTQLHVSSFWPKQKARGGRWPRPQGKLCAAHWPKPKAAKLNARVERALARADVEEAERLKALTSMELEHPLVRFVVAEGDDAYAAALDMAPETGTATLNGLQLEGKAARAAAKMIRHAVKAKRESEGAWTTQVIPSTKA
jgi:hypothetical protein